MNSEVEIKVVDNYKEHAIHEKGNYENKQCSSCYTWRLQNPIKTKYDGLKVQDYVENYSRSREFNNR